MTAAVSTPDVGNGTRTPSQARKAALGSFIGAVVDWYDFLLYGIVAALVFNSEFFAKVSPAMGTLAAFATFGVGFLFRPLGGIVFGHFGDRLGRKRGAQDGFHRPVLGIVEGSPGRFERSCAVGQIVGNDLMHIGRGRAVAGQRSGRLFHDRTGQLDGGLRPGQIGDGRRHGREAIHWLRRRSRRSRRSRRAPEPAVLFYVTDDDQAGKEVERLIRTAGFEPVKAGGIERSSRLEVGGDLHDLVVGRAQAQSLAGG